MEIVNAVIESASIEIEDHGILSAMLTLKKSDGYHQGFGGYGFDWRPSGEERKYSPGAACFIRRCLEVACVRKWSELKGKTVRVRQASGKIEAIGHIVDDDWFEPAKELKKADED